MKDDMKRSRGFESIQRTWNLKEESFKVGSSCKDKSLVSYEA